MKSKPKLMVWLEVSEEEEKASCGCVLRNHGGEGPAFYQCDMHQYAERLLKVLESMVRFYKPLNHDRRLEIQGPDENCTICPAMEAIEMARGMTGEDAREYWAEQEKSRRKGSEVTL